MSRVLLAQFIARFYSSTGRRQPSLPVDFLETTAAKISPKGPSTEQSRNQKQPPRPFVVAIQAPITPKTIHAGIPSFISTTPS